jgi:hypothetical protein
VRGADGRRRNAIPFRIVPARGQISENAVDSSSKESCDVLHEDAVGSNDANGIGVARPEARAGAVCDARAEAGEAEVLAGEAAADDVDRSVDTVDLLPVDECDVAQVDGVGETHGEDGARVRVDLAVGDELDVVRLEAERQTADAFKQAERAPLISIHCWAIVVS